MTLSRATAVNYLIIRIFIGGVNIAAKDASAFVQEISLLPIVNLPVFILLPLNFRRRKVTDIFTHSQSVTAKTSLLKLAVCKEAVVQQCDGCHGFHHGYGTGKHAGIVTATGLQRYGLAVLCDGLLFL